MKKLYIASAVLALFAVFALVLYATSEPRNPAVQKQAAGQAQAPAPKLDPAYFVRFHSPSFGNRSSGVVVVEWLDPECEGCRAIHPAMVRIMAEYSDRVYFVFRYMPFHSNSLYAASVLEEARELGKFKEALNIIFEKQPEWGGHGKPRPELIPGYLETIGIPKEKLERSSVIQKHGSKIKQDEDDGLKVGVTGTPSFFVNGQQVAELGEDSLRAAINRALNQVK
jgi:protein-disulfide isomerase